MNSILIVDDSEMNRYFFHTVFQDSYEVYEASNGVDAMKILNSKPIDLVLLDIVMPEMNGYQVIETMKKDAMLSSIPIIVITGEVERAEKKSLELGADDFIERPYNAFITRKRVENLIERYELRKLREGLREQKRYRTIFDILNIAYWEWNKNSGYYHSESYKAYAISELKDEDMWDDTKPFQYVHPDDVQKMRDYMIPHSEEEIRKSAIIRCKKIDGSYRWTEMFSIAETGADGSLQRLVSVMRDVEQEWQEQKEQLEDALMAAKDANQAKSDFLSRVSHDMRTPLNVILSIAKLVPEERPSYDVMLSYFKTVTEEGTFLLRLINDVLDMQKMESGVIELNPEPIEFENIINPVVAQAKNLAQEKKIRFDVQIKHFIEGAKAFIDPLRMQQLLMNLLSNAMKYTPEGGKVEMIFENLSFHENEAVDQIIIRDNGQGMTKEFMEHMYEPFSQENGGSTSTTRGTGLGLSIVKKIVDIMGGTITCESEIGKGTKYTIILRTTIMLSSKDAKPVKSDYAMMDDEALMGRRILLCEDHPMNAMLTSKLLRRKGLLVTHAENGKVGVEYFKESSNHYYDAILMDIRMPVMDGLEATRQIRSLDRDDAKKVPVIAMTANAFNEDVQQCLEVGMNAHLAKPMEPMKIWEALCEHIDFSKNISKLKVIVVDDVEVNAVAVAESIRENYDPIIAASGPEALKLLKEHSDVVAVITDMIMPHMDGLELIKQIRKKREYDSIAILANTQYGERTKEEEILKAGADDFIYKPARPAIIMTRLENVLPRRNNMRRL